MKNDVFIELGANPQVFFNKLYDYLGNNIDSNLCRSVANLLSLDYVMRVKFSPELPLYINLCTNRLQKYLGERVILDHGLAETMELFTVAISPDDESADKSTKSQEQLIDAMIESVLAESFDGLSPEEKTAMRSVIKEIIHGKNKKELLNMISSDPGLFRDLIANALKTKKLGQEASASVINYLQNLSAQSRILENQKTDLRNFAGKIAISAGLFATASLGFVFSGLVLPAIIIPTAIISIKAASNIGEKVANNAISKNSEIEYSSLVLNQTKNNTIEITGQSPVINKTIKKQQKANVTQELQAQGASIAGSISAPLNTSGVANNSFKEKQKQLTKSLAKEQKL